MDGRRKEEETGVKVGVGDRWVGMGFVDYFGKGSEEVGRWEGCFVGFERGYIQGLPGLRSGVVKYTIERMHNECVGVEKEDLVVEGELE